MNKKYIYLFLILFLPGLVFMFFDSLQPDYRPLPKLGPKYVEAGDTVYHTIPDFELISQTGDVVRSSDFSNKIYVANFFFTSCPNPEFCPKLASNMNKLQRKFINVPPVKLISFTVDPERDSVPVIAKYADGYFARPDKWFFLTGDREMIYHIAQKGYLVSTIYGGDDPVSFIHTDKMVLIDKEKRIRGYYNGRDDEDINNLIIDAKILLQEYTYLEHKGQTKIEYKSPTND